MSAPPSQNPNASWEEFYKFLQGFSQAPVPTADQMTNIAAYAPLWGLEQQAQAFTLQNQTYALNLKKLANDYNLSKEQLRQVELQTKFQEGPYFEYLKQKTIDDTAISKEGTKQSVNQTLDSAYRTQAARYGAAAEHDRMLAEQANYNHISGIGHLSPLGY